MENEIVEKANDVKELLDKNIAQTENVKTAIDFLTTREALKKEDTIQTLVDEKEKELESDAKAKRVQAEAELISKEVEKVKQEKEKELTELDKIISAKQKEVEQLKVDSDKEQAFFDSNKDILKYIGIIEKKSIKTMQALMFPATIVFVLVQILLFPLTLIGLLLETVVNIIGGICGAIKNNAVKIIMSILVIAVIIGGSFCAYYFGGKLIL